MAEPNPAVGDTTLPVYSPRPARARKPTEKVSRAESDSTHQLSAVATSPRSIRVRKASLRQQYTEASDQEEEEEAKEQLPALAAAPKPKRAYKKRASAINDLPDRQKRKQSMVQVNGGDATEEPRPKRKRQSGTRKGKDGNALSATAPIDADADAASSEGSFLAIQAEAQKHKQQLESLEKTTRAKIYKLLNNLDRRALQDVLADRAVEDETLMLQLMTAHHQAIQKIYSENAELKQQLSGVGVNKARVNGHPAPPDASGTESEASSHSPLKQANNRPNDLTQKQRIEARELKSEMWKKAKLAYMVPDGMKPPVSGPIGVGTVRGGKNVVNAGYDFRLRCHWRLTKKDRDGKNIDYGTKSPATKRSKVDLLPSLQNLSEDELAKEILKRQWEQDRKVAAGIPLPEFSALS